jgi:pimeloyl-ACP methyl ester carboxylesterase
LITAIILGLFITAIGFAILLGFRYRKWLYHCTHQLESGSDLIDISNGQVEYAIHGTRGPVILFVHGQPGGYDQGDELGRVSVQHGFRMITVSRPGYLRTSIDVGRKPAEQADAFAQVLDALHISHVVVVSLSGGGPAAIQFILRHPARCMAFAAISSVSCSKTPPSSVLSRLLSSRLFTSNFIGWLIGFLVERWPGFFAKALISNVDEQIEVLLDPLKLSMLKGLAQTAIQLPAERRAGNRNDVEQFRVLPLFSVERIQIPTLVIHGTADFQVPYAHGLFLAENVPGVELYAVEGGTHAIFVTHVHQVLSQLFAFLVKHSDENAILS